MICKQNGNFVTMIAENHEDLAYLRKEYPAVREGNAVTVAETPKPSFKKENGHGKVDT